MAEIIREVDDLHRSVANLKDQWKAVNHGCDLFARATTKSNSELTSRVDSLTTFMESQSQKQDSRIDALAKRIEAQSKSIARLETIFLDDKASGKRIQSSKPSSSNNEDQVPFFHNLGNQDEIPLGYRGIRSLLENRNGLWKKIEFPIFDGKYPSIWLNRVERYFRLGNYSDQDKLEQISVSFEGAVLSWFITEKVADPFRDWDDFKRRVVKQYHTVKSFSPVAGNLTNESKSQKNVVLEIEVVQKTESSILDEHHLHSGDFNSFLMQDMVEMQSKEFHQNCLSSEPKMMDVVLKMESFPASTQEAMLACIENNVDSKDTWGNDSGCSYSVYGDLVADSHKPGATCTHASAVTREMTALVQEHKSPVKTVSHLEIGCVLKPHRSSSCECIKEASGSGAKEPVNRALSHTNSDSDVWLREIDSLSSKAPPRRTKKKQKKFLQSWHFKFKSESGIRKTNYSRLAVIQHHTISSLKRWKYDWSVWHCWRNKTLKKIKFSKIQQHIKPFHECGFRVCVLSFQQEFQPLFKKRLMAVTVQQQHKMWPGQKGVLKLVDGLVDDSISDADQSELTYAVAATRRGVCVHMHLQVHKEEASDEVMGFRRYRTTTVRNDSELMRVHHWTVIHYVFMGPIDWVNLSGMDCLLDIFSGLVDLIKRKIPTLLMIQYVILDDVEEMLHDTLFPQTVELHTSLLRRHAFLIEIEKSYRQFEHAFWPARVLELIMKTDIFVLHHSPITRYKAVKLGNVRLNVVLIFCMRKCNKRIEEDKITVKKWMIADFAICVGNALHHYKVAWISKEVRQVLHFKGVMIEPQKQLQFYIVNTKVYESGEEIDGIMAASSCLRLHREMTIFSISHDLRLLIALEQVQRRVTFLQSTFCLKRCGSKYLKEEYAHLLYASVTGASDLTHTDVRVMMQHTTRLKQYKNWWFKYKDYLMKHKRAMVAQGLQQLWSSLLSSLITDQESYWERAMDIISQFPHLKLEGKLRFDEAGIDKYHS